MTDDNMALRRGHVKNGTPQNLIPIKSHWKLNWQLRLTRLKNAGAFSPAALDCALGLSSCMFEKSLAEVSASFLAKKTGLGKRSVVRALGELERTPDTVIVRVRGQWEGRVKSRYAMVLTAEDLGADAGALRVTGPVASDSWVTPESPSRVTPESPSRVTPESPNNTNYAKQREAELVSPDAGVAGGGAAAPPLGGDVSEAAASGDTRAMRAAFEEFKRVYLRKEGFAKAWSEFQAAIARGVPVEAILDGARRYAAAKVNVDSNWLKFPGTWLRDECWTEDPKPPRPKPERSASKASKLNGKAEHHDEHHDEADDADAETPEERAAREVGFAIGSTVWERSTGKAYVVNRVEDLGDGSFMVWAGGFGFPRSHLAHQDPWTLEQRLERAKRAAQWEADAPKREAERREREACVEAQRRVEAEQKRLTEETLAKFPVGSYVRTIYNDDRVRGRVLAVYGDEANVDFGRWDGDDCNMVLAHELVLLESALTDAA
jgi:hypothetical protein